MLKRTKYHFRRRRVTKPKLLRVYQEKNEARVAKEMGDSLCVLAQRATYSCSSFAVTKGQNKSSVYAVKRARSDASVPIPKFTLGIPVPEASRPYLLTTFSDGSVHFEIHARCSGIVPQES
jgi:hypothetical protein